MPGSQVVLDGGAGDKEHTLPAWHSMVRARCFLSVANTTTYSLPYLLQAHQYCAVTYYM